MKSLAFLTLTIMLLHLHAVRAQHKEKIRRMQGRWLTEADTNSVLIFDKQYVYQLYTGTSYIDTFKYYFTDSCRYSSARSDFMFWVNKNETDDTTWLEVLGVNSNSLSFFVYNTSIPLWILTKAPNQK